MPDVPTETVTIAEAAELLGVHRNTVRNRIKAGRYKAHKVVTPQGDTYAIERESLGVTPANGTHNPSHAQVRHNGAVSPQAGMLVGDGQEAHQLAVVQRLLAPFVEELSRTNAELGRTQERLAATERERDELRQRVADLETEDHLGTAAARQDDPEATESADVADEPRSGVRAWWHRLWGRT
jgi:excisionase family DNA binding protein